MKLTIPTFTVIPQAPEADWQPAPASMSLGTGQYRVTITGKAQAALIDSEQVFFKPSFNEVGGPSVTAANYNWILMQGDPAGCGYTGSNGPTTTLNEMSTITGVAPTPQPFLWDGIVTVSVAGDITLLTASGGTDPAKTTTFSDVVIEVLPV